MQKKQSTIRNANIIGMLLMYLKWFVCISSNPIRKNSLKRHAQAEEPRQRRDRELHIHLLEVVVYDRQTALHERLEDALVEERAVH